MELQSTPGKPGNQQASMFFGLERKLKGLFAFESELKWVNIAILCAMHIGGVYWSYLYAFPVKWQSVVFAYVMIYFTGYGVSIGAHRYWSHRSFKATAPLHFLLIIMHCSAGQNSILNWVRDHRVHHKYTDSSADPHDSRRGLFFSHIGWLMMKKKPEVIAGGKEVSLDDLTSDPMVLWQERNFTKLKLLCCFVLPTVAGVVLWGESWRCAIAWQCFIRHILSLHNELTINSLAHTYGDRPYNKNMQARDNWLYNITTAGDGNHNYHHAFPYDYRSTEKLSPSHVSGYLIKLWERMGLAYDLKEATPANIKSYSEKKGDGSRMFEVMEEQNNVKCN